MKKEMKEKLQKAKNDTKKLKLNESLIEGKLKEIKEIVKGNNENSQITGLENEEILKIFLK